VHTSPTRCGAKWQDLIPNSCLVASQPIRSTQLEIEIHEAGSFRFEIGTLQRPHLVKAECETTLLVDHNSSTNRYHALPGTLRVRTIGPTLRPTTPTPGPVAG
jgi:hypothetical protein